MTTDLTPTELKQRAIDLLRLRYAEQRKAVAAVEPRLAEYYDHLCEFSSNVKGDERDLHNCSELLGALKFLRLLRSYTLDRPLLADIIYKYEGEWRQVDGLWRHVRGGVRHPGSSGEAYYRLQPFQVFVLAAIFALKAWVNTENEAGSRELLPTEEVRDGMIYDLRRLCTEFTLYTPRKTAKTQLSAFIQFYFFMNADVNAECLCCANSADQSKILFNRTKALIHQMDPKEQRIRFTAQTVNWKTGQFRTASLTSLSAGGRTKDGLCAQLCSADEYGSAGYINGSSDMGKLVSVVESSMGPRREPLTFISTTAGLITEGPFIDKLAGIEQALLGELADTPPTDSDRQMCLLLQPDVYERGDVDYMLTSRPLRRKINPMLGIIVQHSFYDDEIQKSRHNPEKQNEVVSKLLNVYQSATVKEWIRPEEIRRLQVPMRIDECVDTEGWDVYCGLDFSRGDDLNGVSFLAVRWNERTGEMEFFADMDSYMSEQAISESPLRALFEKWVAEGWLHAVSGQTFDPAVVVNRIIELHNKGVNFLGFGYDPYNAKTVINALSQWVYELGLPPEQIILPVRQNFATYNPAVNEFDYMVHRSFMNAQTGKNEPAPMIRFSKNPLWPHEFSNCVLSESSDGMGNVKPIKRTASGKVDNVQMLLSALILYDQSEFMDSRREK